MLKTAWLWMCLLLCVVVSAEPIVWLEVPAPRAADITLAVEALEIWDTETAIVTTRIEYVTNLYDGLRDRTPPGMQIVGGLKTFPVLPTYSDPAGWEAIAAACLRVAELTGTPICLLDNETALATYHRGEVTIDYVELATSLEPLAATGLLIWWYQPELLDDDPRFPGRYQHTKRLVATVAEAVPRSVFSMGFAAWNDWWANRRGEVDRRLATIALVGADRVQDRLFVTDDGLFGRSNKRCHTPAEARELSQRLIGPIIYYPGHGDWLSTGRAYRAEREWAALKEGG